MKYIRHIVLRFNKLLNKKNGCNESLELSIKHNKQSHRIIEEKEFKRRTYYVEFGNTVNDYIQ